MTRGTAPRRLIPMLAHSWRLWGRRSGPAARATSALDTVARPCLVQPVPSDGCRLGLAAAAAATALLLAAALAPLAGCRSRAPQPRAGQAVEAAAPTPAPVRAYLFFPGDDTLLHREVRTLAELPEAPAPRLRAVLEELIAGSREGLAPAFPWAATVEAVFFDRDGNAYVDLGAPPAGGLAGASTEVMLVYAVVNTVVANTRGVERVQLLFGGNEVATLGSVDLSRPLAPQPQLVAQ